MSKTKDPPKDAEVSREDHIASIIECAERKLHFALELEQSDTAKANITLGMVAAVKAALSHLRDARGELAKD